MKTVFCLSILALVFATSLGLERKPGSYGSANWLYRRGLAIAREGNERKRINVVDNLKPANRLNKEAQKKPYSVQEVNTINRGTFTRSGGYNSLPSWIPWSNPPIYKVKLPISYYVIDFLRNVARSIAGALNRIVGTVAFVLNRVVMVVFVAVNLLAGLISNIITIITYPFRFIYEHTIEPFKTLIYIFLAPIDALRRIVWFFVRTFLVKPVKALGAMVTAGILDLINSIASVISAVLGAPFNLAAAYLGELEKVIRLSPY